jgi:hypothetical protein
VLSKIDGTNYNTQWVTPASGSGAAVYDASGTSLSAAHIVVGTIAINFATTTQINFSGSAQFTNTPVCTVSEYDSTTTPHLFKVVGATNTSVSIRNTNGSVNSTAAYHCIGN